MSACTPKARPMEGPCRRIPLEKGLLTCMIILWTATSADARLTCKVTDHGAKGNGKEYDTTAIQSAVDECSQPGQPGLVMFEPGREYLTGTIVLSNSVHVELPANTSILAGVNREDFGPEQADWYLLMFLRCHDCSISGGGRLDGRARLWVTGEVAGWIKQVRNFQDPSCHIRGECRPRLLGVRDSEKVHVEDIEMFDSIYWTLHIIGSRAVTVKSVTVNNDFAIPNNDGIDVDSSKLVWISNCQVTAWDDGICVKANYPGVSTEDVLVENCTIRSRAAALKVGTESLADFKTIVFQNINIVDSHRGMAIQLRDGGAIENVLFSNITLTTWQYTGKDWLAEWGEAEPIYVTALPRTAETKLGSISGVTFQHIRAVSESGVLVVGHPDSVIQDLSIIDMELDLSQITEEAGGFHDLRPSTYDIIHNVSDDAFYLEQANHVNLTNIRVTWGSPARPTWGQVLNVKPRTVHALNIQGLVVHDESAHPHEHVDSSETLPVWVASKASGLMSWVQSLRHSAASGATLSLQENAAKGVKGQQAASSASTIVISITGVVLAGILVAHVLDFRLLSRFNDGSKAVHRRAHR